TANRAASWDGSAWTVLGTDLGSGAKTETVYNNELYYFGEGAFNNQHYAAKWTAGTFTGIESLKADNNISMFPNPTKNKVNIKLDSKDISPNTTLTVLNAIGQVVLQTPLARTASSVDLGDLSSGLYLYRLQDTNGIIGTGKVVVE